MHTSPPHPPPPPPSSCKHLTNLTPPTATPAITYYSHTCQGSSRESLVIATDGSPSGALLVYVTSYVGSCKFLSAQCCSLSTPAVLIHVCLLGMGKDAPHSSVAHPHGCYILQWSRQFARCTKWIWWRQFIWHSLFTWRWMTVFTAHKWSNVHISGDILERRWSSLRLGCLLL